MAEAEEVTEAPEATLADVLGEDPVSTAKDSPAPEPDMVELSEFKVLDLGDDSDPVSVEEAYKAVFGYEPSESPEALAKELFKENLLAATNSIVQLAGFGQNERIRFDAAKYIHESFFGKPGAPGGAAAQATWEGFFKEMGVTMPTEEQLKESGGKE